jgi:hypothetical protein
VALQERRRGWNSLLLPSHHVIPSAILWYSKNAVIRCQQLDIWLFRTQTCEKQISFLYKLLSQCYFIMLLENRLSHPTILILRVELAKYVSFCFSDSFYFLLTVSQLSIQGKRFIKSLTFQRNGLIKHSRSRNGDCCTLLLMYLVTLSLTL